MDQNPKTPIACPKLFKSIGADGLDPCEDCSRLGVSCFRYPHTPSMCPKLVAWQETLVNTASYDGVGPCHSCPHAAECVGAEISIMTATATELEEDLENLTPISVLRRSHG